MKNRQKIMPDLQKSTIFWGSDETNESLISKLLSGSTLVYYKNYANPPVPEGYRHVCGEWNNGFIIEREADKSQFAWVPVGSFVPCKRINEKSLFGEFGQYTNEDLIKKMFSIKKYGGFYISCYAISKGEEEKPQSVRGEKPWTEIDFEEAKEVASGFEPRGPVTSQITFDIEFDLVLLWFIKSGAKTLDEIKIDSTNWGNYWNTMDSPKDVVETGTRKEWCVNGIYDFTGNIDEWAQTQEKEFICVTRGGDCHGDGCHCPAISRHYRDVKARFRTTGFRITLCIA